jgi:UDP-N-acetylglucosamine 4,6-dehydratase/5-epimerase
MFQNKTILITGGTGSFGKKFISVVLKKYKNVKKIIVFSRDELKQFDMIQHYINSPNFNKLRFFLGDIRDKSRLNMAFKDVDIVIHAAAFKQVPSSEYNPLETIKTNVFGTQNVVESCIDNKVEQLISLSTDKASSPINLYGATKLLADKLTVGAQNFKGKEKFISCVVRYGNVMASRGSIIPILFKKRNEKNIDLTHDKMTRFNISLLEAVNLVLLAIKDGRGGEIFVPKLSSYRLVDLARAIAPKAKLRFNGIRPGEKIHEEMISYSESLNTVEYPNHYVMLPSFKDYSIDTYIKKNGGKKIKKQFSYTSDANQNFLTIKQLKKIIYQDLD